MTVTCITIHVYNNIYLSSILLITPYIEGLNFTHISKKRKIPLLERLVTSTPSMSLNT